MAAMTSAPVRSVPAQVLGTESLREKMTKSAAERGCQSRISGYSNGKNETPAMSSTPDLKDCSLAMHPDLFSRGRHQLTVHETLQIECGADPNAGKVLVWTNSRTRRVQRCILRCGANERRESRVLKNLSSLVAPHSKLEMEVRSLAGLVYEE